MKIFKRLFCWFEGVWYSLIYGAPTTTGHDLIIDRQYKNVTIEVLKCEYCGKEYLKWEGEVCQEKTEVEETVG